MTFDSSFGVKPLGRADISHKRSLDIDRFYYGTTYYPEHWDADVREEDAGRMAEAGINIVRMAEFAWDLMEPEEGKYDFTLFSETIARLGMQGIKTILCTPTATPPRWLTEKHPYILRVDSESLVLEHGTRQHCCHTNPLFREYSRKITRAMADYFRKSPDVVGWQTDNEINCHFSECHCDACQEGFREFLKLKFNGNIKELNRTWGNAFWALTYTSFNQICTPKARPAYPNPAQMLDYYRFINWSVSRFQHEQIKVLRETNPDWFVTHNGLFRHIDYRGQFTKDLDFLGYDVYPFFQYDPDQRFSDQIWNLDRTRSFSGNFMIPEQQSGPGGQGHYMHDTPEPGEVRRMTWTSIARGCDAFLYFRWRTCRFGAEEYWCGILDHDNISRRRYDEISRVGKEVKKAGPDILGTYVYVDTAVAGIDMDVEEGHGIYSCGLPGPRQMSSSVHRWLREKGYAVGVVHPEDDLSDLRLYVITHWHMFDPAWVPALEKFVRKGGVLVIGARTHIRDNDNNVIARTPPGCLADLAGVKVDEYGRQNMPEKRPLFLLKGKSKVQTDHWYEILAPDKGTRTSATWASRHLKGTPAATERKLGKGKVIYVGTFLTPEVLDLLMPGAVRSAGLKKLIPGLPKGVDCSLRTDGKKKVWFLINGTERVKTVSNVPSGTNLFTDKKVPKTLKLKPHEVIIIKARSLSENPA